ncbi:MAG: O-acetyl-ADP-ribose deacetylase [Desulfarculaceae bacterium]|nr:O-acetyl-ADP-ribose deacetylase [Desulfarculaceae bacterium]
MAVEKMIGETRLILSQGDLTQADEEAMVNAANSALAGGGGVDGAIHQAGGPEIMAEGRAIGHCPTGEAVITTAGKLKAKKVIHTVGPIYQGRPEDPRLLARAYRSSLKLAAEYKLKSVAFPSLSTGAYGYPLAEAAQVALQAVKEGIEANPGSFQRVRFVLFSQAAYDAYAQALARL